MSQDLLSKDQMSTLFKVSIVVAAVGAINWYTSAMGKNLVNLATGAKQGIPLLTKTEKAIYLAVGIAGAIVLYGLYQEIILIR